MTNIIRGMVLIGALASAMFLTGCSSMFAVGHENFRCQGTDKGGVCGPVDYIYEHKDELLQKNISSQVRYVDGNIAVENLNGKTTVYEVKEVVVNEKGGSCPVSDEKACEMMGYKKVTKKKILKPIVELPLKAKQDKYNKIPVPVREEALVQRVLVYPYVSKDGNLISKHFIYVVIRSGRWLSPEGIPYKKEETK